MSRMTLNNVITGRLNRPQRIVVHGVDGVGKSSFAAAAPSPIFICAEDGTAHLDVKRFPNPEGWDDIMDAISVLYDDDHGYQTVVLDSADWAEQIARDAVCADKGVQSVEDIGYGKGWVLTQEKFTHLLRGFNALYAKGMHVIIIAHSQVKAFNDPEQEIPFDRYVMKLDKRIDPLLREWADYVLFANWDLRVDVETTKTGKPIKTTARGRSYGKHLLFTQRSAAFDAKRRFNIPDRLPLDWDSFWSAHQAAAGFTNPPTSTQSTSVQTFTTKDA